MSEIAQIIVFLENIADHFCLSGLNCMKWIPFRIVLRKGSAGNFDRQDKNSNYQQLNRYRFIINTHQ